MRRPPTPLSLTHRGTAIWTPEAILITLSCEIDALAARIDQRFTLDAAASTRFADETLRHFEQVNGLQALISKIIAEQVSRHEYDAKHQSLVDLVTALSVRQDKADARGLGGQQMFGWIIAAISVLFGIAGLIGHFLR